MSLEKKVSEWEVTSGIVDVFAQWRALKTTRLPVSDDVEFFSRLLRHPKNIKYIASKCASSPFLYFDSRQLKGTWEIKFEKVEKEAETK